MQNKFYLQILGPWRLVLDGRTIELPNRKARALVAYLITHSSAVLSRAELCDMFWPEKSTEKSRASLRQCLSSIRKATEPFGTPIISVVGDQVALQRSLLGTDWDELEDRLLHERTDAKTLEACRTAKRMFSDIQNVSPAFETWAQGARDVALTRIASHLNKISSNRDHALERRIDAAQTAQELDEFDETALRSLMRAHVEAGRAPKALRLYGKFYELLEQELDAEPSRETQELAVEIKLVQAPEMPTSVERVPAKAAVPTLTTMAILPFDVTGDPAQDKLLSLGLLEHLTCHLATFKAPAVISSNTTRKYHGQIPRPLDVGNELNAQYVLTGSVRLTPRRASLAAQLVEAQSERVVWADTRLCAANELFDLNMPIAQDIARAILPSVDAEELRNSLSIPADELEPYHLILQAKDLVFKLVYEDFIAAGRLLQRAVEVGPQFAPAHAMLADWYSIHLWEGWSDNAKADRMALDHHARKAISLAPRDGRVMALWAHNRMMFNREYDFALSLIKDAIHLCPNDAQALAFSVPTLANTRNSDAAVENGLKALALSPYDPFIFRNEHFLGLALYVQGDYEQSAEYGLSCFRRAPNYRSNIRATIAALCAAGRLQEAGPLVEHHIDITPDFTVTEFSKIHGMQDPEDRRVFASYLLAAGLPA